SVSSAQRGPGLASRQRSSSAGSAPPAGVNAQRGPGLASRQRSTGNGLGTVTVAAQRGPGLASRQRGPEDDEAPPVARSAQRGPGLASRQRRPARRPSSPPLYRSTRAGTRVPATGLRSGGRTTPRALNEGRDSRPGNGEASASGRTPARL